MGYTRCFCRFISREIWRNRITLAGSYRTTSAALTGNLYFRIGKLELLTILSTPYTVTCYTLTRIARALNNIFFKYLSAILGDETVELSAQLETSVNIGEHAFAQMQGDLDRQRLLGERPPADPLADIMFKQMQQKER